MPNPTDTRLDDLERDLGPALRKGFDVAPRPGFTAALRADLYSVASRQRSPRARLWLVGRRTWAGLAAALAGSVVVGSAVLVTRPQTASAEEAISQLQTEAVTSLAASPSGACPGAAGGGTVVAIGGGGPETQGPVTVRGSGAASPTELSDKLAQALGISGDRVRQAMLDTLRAETPSGSPPDPMASIAQQLGVSTDQVCAAFSGTPIALTVGQARTQSSGPNKRAPAGARALDGDQMLNLSTATPAQLARPAQQLGVSPDKLADAVHRAAATLAQTTAPEPRNKDDVIARFAQNVGMSPDTVKAAITQVEGPNHFYFAVQLPDFRK